jgi:hypothetical protein
MMKERSQKIYFYLFFFKSFTLNLRVTKINSFISSVSRSILFFGSESAARKRNE